MIFVALTSQSVFQSAVGVGVNIGYKPVVKGLFRFFIYPAGKHAHSEVLDFITEDAGRYRSLEEWQEAQELYREQLQCRETVRSGMQKKQEKQENSGITLLTVHAAKGAGIRPCVDPGL